MGGSGFTLPDNSVLRLVPRVVAPEQALLLETFAYSADSIDMSYGLMLRLANMVGEKPENLTKNIKIQLLNNAWSMVDALHVVRQILQALKPAGPVAAKFLGDHETATRLRNAMDHIKDQAKNLSLKKKAEPPLIGALGWNFIPDEAIVMANDGSIAELKRGVSITTSVGRVRKKTQMSIANPGDGTSLQNNISSLQLEAFDCLIELMPAYRDFVALANAMDSAFAKHISEQARKLADENDASYDELMEAAGAGLSTFAIWESVSDPQTPPSAEGAPA